MNQEEFAAVCHRHALKVTPQRSEIFRQMQACRDHLSAEALYRRVRRVFPRISFDTVHRTLQTFAAVGLARVVEGTGLPRRFDVNTRRHHHFWCRHCNRLIDIPHDGLKVGRIPAVLEGRHHVASARLVLEGVCEDCLASGSKSPNPGLDGGLEL